MKPRLSALALVACLSITGGAQATPKWSVRVAESVMRRNPVIFEKWDYTAGLMLHYYLTGDTRSRDAAVGLPAVRRIGVELAWSWLRYQPDSAITKWYHAKYGAAGPTARRIGIVAVARRVIILLWKYATTGVLPEGVRRLAA